MSRLLNTVAAALCAVFTFACQSEAPESATAGAPMASVETFDSGLARLQTADGRQFDAFGMDLTAFGGVLREAVPVDALTLVSADVVELLQDGVSRTGLEVAHRPLMAMGGADGCGTSCSSQTGREYCCCPSGGTGVIAAVR